MEESLNSFCVNLYSSCSKDMGSNVFFSPCSISSAFAMVLAGARQETRTEIMKALALSEMDEALLYGAIKSCLAFHLSTSDGVSISSANGLFVEEKFQLLDEYVATIKEYFDACANTMKFVSEPDQSLEALNRWISEKTCSKINNMLTQDFVNRYTRVVLANALYFKGNWTNKFDAARTKDGEFQRLDKSKKTMKFMHKMYKYGFDELTELDASVAVFPFGDENQSRVEMLIVLPKEADGLPKLVKRLCEINPQTSATYLEKILSSTYREVEVNVTLPKFKLEESLDLITPLSSMGMTSVFSSDVADLSGIEPSKSLFVGGALHKAVLEVNEEGAEAAAATCIGVVEQCAFARQPIIREFHVDHPFFLTILSKSGESTRCPLFVGHCSDPVPFE